jgi:hypothetical protein
MEPGLEITTFKLWGATCAEFIAANAEIDAFLKRQPGFRSRYLAEQADGTIIDALLWDSVAAGEAAMQRLLTEMAASPVHALIDQATVQWSCTAVKHQLL